MSANPFISTELCDPEYIASRYRTVRTYSSELAAKLSAEDACVQSMPDCSPAKWHLAHTTWFFETFLLEPFVANFKPYNPHFKVLFNSYYNTVGEQYSRPHRGLLTRPSLEDVLDYRRSVDAQVETLIANSSTQEIANIIEVGLNHEQQHQELLLMDIKHLFWCNPLLPIFQRLDSSVEQVPIQTSRWVKFDGGIVDVGAGDNAFSFDNEKPAHQALVSDFELSANLVSNEDYLAFINDGGYSTANLWLSDGWSCVNQNGWIAPLYWRKVASGWSEFTLYGLRPLDLAAPVVHLSYYEADAFARWAGARLPTEFEWESAAWKCTSAETSEVQRPAMSRLHPYALKDAQTPSLNGLFGQVWQWTASAYLPYPGYKTPPGAIGEYNGKFMSNQMVLRGSCCVTPQQHSRISYRNFFYPQCRWQFGGLRLAK